jgi:micrococcal nuclease
MEKSSSQGTEHHVPKTEVTQPTPSIPSAPGVVGSPKKDGPLTINPDAGSSKPAGEHLSLDLGSGAFVATEPVKVPKVAWNKPETVVEAKPSSLKGPTERAVVTYVEDGDTARLQRGDGSSINCRLDFDAPETAHPKVGKKGQAYGEESKKTLQEMILNKEVTLKISKPATVDSNFNRATCQIEIEGKNLSKEMIRQGMAWVYREYNNNPELLGLEAEARNSKVGLWADPNPIYPPVFRRQLRQGR